MGAPTSAAGPREGLEHASTGGDVGPSAAEAQHGEATGGELDLYGRHGVGVGAFSGEREHHGRERRLVPHDETEPDVVLMDEPASALDPIATQAIEELMHNLKSEYTFVIVTHNMQQAARVADMTAFFSISQGSEGQRFGELIEYDQTEKIFTAPSDKKTEDYVTGRFG